MPNLKEDYELLKGHGSIGCKDVICPAEKRQLLEILERIIIELDSKTECNRKHQ
jgi:hypothetical protein